MTDQDVRWAPGHEPGTESDSTGQQQDYFGFQRGEKFTFPDGVTYIEIQALNEGKKKEFQDKVSKDLVLEQRTGNARMSVLQGTERHELIKAACVDWNLKRGDTLVPFNKINLNDFLTLGDPKIIENLEKAIRKLNPWLMADMKSEDIQREIDNLQEMLEEAKKREAGEGS
jgi:hypothetical protein